MIGYSRLLFMISSHRYKEPVTSYASQQLSTKRAFSIFPNSEYHPDRKRWIVMQNENPDSTLIYYLSVRKAHMTDANVYGAK